MRTSLNIIPLLFIVSIAMGCSTKPKPAEDGAQAPEAQSGKEASADAKDPSADAKEPSADAKEPSADAKEAPADKGQADRASATVKAESLYSKGYPVTPAARIVETDVCPKGAYLSKVRDDSNDVAKCSCFYGSVSPEAEGKKLFGVVRPDGSDVLGSAFQCSDTGDPCDTIRMAVCPNIRGCKALDGRWYAALAQATRTHYKSDYLGYELFVNVSSDESVDIPYITGGMDTSLESGRGGTCVLDRTDGIPLFSLVPDAKDNFACNLPSCECGKEICHNGQLCKGGKCEWDKQEAIPLDEENSIVYTFELIENGPEFDLANVTSKLYEECKRTKDPYCVISEDDDESFGIRRYDTKTCKGGRLYCHGTANFPIPKPEAPGYICKKVDTQGYADDIKAWVCSDEKGCGCGSTQCPVNSACIDGKCYCGSQAIMDKQTIPQGYACDLSASDLQLLRCDAESCKCGEETCRKGETCNPIGGGECMCDAQSRLSGKDSADYQCVETNRRSHEHAWVCNNPKGCQCEGTVCPKGASCSRDGCFCGDVAVEHKMSGYSCIDNALVCTSGNCKCDGKGVKKNETCSPKPCGAVSAHRTTKDACVCEGKTMDANAYRCVDIQRKEKALCIQESGCTCGDVQCPYMSLCSNGTCLDRLSVKPFPEDIDVKDGIAWCDEEEGCACGKKTCEKGKYCVNGVCRRDPYTRKSDLGEYVDQFKGKILYYRFVYNDSFEDVYPELNNRAIQREYLLYLMNHRNSDDMPDLDICDLMDFKAGKEAFELHEYNKDDYDQHSVCANPEYVSTDYESVYPAVGFIEKCGTGEAPEDVAVKYCYMRLNVERTECGGAMRVEFSGWQGEDFSFDH